MVLIVAIINYINLATAQATKRAKEVGVRKATGANRSQLITQYLTESLIQTLLAAVIALLLAEALLPIFNNIIDRQLSLLGSSLVFWIVPVLLLFSLLVGILAGVYPAFVISSFQPAKVLKGKFLGSSENTGLRKLLVGGQFTVSIGLIVVMTFIFMQVQYMMNYNLGFQPEQVVVVPLNEGASHRKLANAKASFESIPGVLKVSTSSNIPGRQFSDWSMTIEGNEENVNPFMLFTDEDFIETIGVELESGRYLSDDIANDSINNFVVNETFVKRYNIENPIGHRVKFIFDESYGKIVGVLKDFHYRGLENEIGPLAITARHQRRFATFKVSTTNLNQTISTIESLWGKRIEPAYPMRFSFLNEDFQEQYAEQQRFGNTMLYATLLTLIIAILGLFGLTTFSVERRVKEIGIRKVLGASVFNIVSLFSKDFLKLVLIAFLIAVPLSWYITNLWLEDFAYRIPIKWWVFGLAGIVAIIVTVLTVSIQSIKAAISNPIKSLRTE